MNINNVEFIKSAAAASGFISDGLPQVVFAGRSNVGKSSVINRLLNRKKIARTSAQPGKTIHVNYFLVDKSVYFVDLPGYGYARVPKKERDRWSGLMEAFFSEAGRITLGVMIVDARHKPTGDDITMAGWFDQAGRPLVIVANKADKIKKAEMEHNLAVIRETLHPGAGKRIIAFSAETGANRDMLIEEIERAVKE